MKRLSCKRRGVAYVTGPKYASLYAHIDAEVLVEEEVGKKTLKMSSSKLGVNQHVEKMEKTFVCNKCGKGFQSSKALCGHMACHSEKDHKGSSNQKQQLVIMDSQSDTESGAKNLRRRSMRAKRYKRVDPGVDSRTKLDVYNDCLSGVEQEQEEGAISLMMMSRDSANWVGLNSIGDSSDNNSVILEARSVSTNLARRNGLKRSGYDMDDSVRKFGIKRMKILGDSESEYVRAGAKNVELDVKIKDLRKKKLEKGLQAEQTSSINKFKSAMDEGFKYGLSKGGQTCSLMERPKRDLYSRMGSVNGSYNAMSQYSNAEIFRRLEHSQSHRSSNANVTGQRKTSKAASTNESGENSFETDGSPDVRNGKSLVKYHSNNVGDNCKRGKHECPICFKVFRSVQALGGHRRVHLSEGSANIKKQNGTQLHDFLDLNQPAPVEDEDACESMGSYGRIEALPQA